MINPRFGILMESVRVGPKTARNRFFQTPHSSGTGFWMPHIRAGLREVRAEGGWAVVNTGYCSIHPSCDDHPLDYPRLWDDEDIKTHELMVDAVHRHGALAGVELFHGASNVSNGFTRLPKISPSGADRYAPAHAWMQPGQSRPMDREDIRNLHAWHKAAVERAVKAGFDLIYVYGGMDYLPYQFLSPKLNRRSDEYGGSIENRLRLTRELIEITREASKGTVAVAFRFSVDELMNVPSDHAPSEAHEVVQIMGDDPDLWDIKLSDWPQETMTARFSDEGSHEELYAWVKQVTDKPVVSMGRFTSPDKMVGQIKKGLLDFIGAARPSIADPFIPRKIEEGREDEIRECIGCNICVATYSQGVNVRCTQNPTFGEEWRRGWHPERSRPKKSDQRVAIIGGGPAGLECALVLGRRGYNVALCDAASTFGGRASREAKLPGLSTFQRVVDYRLGRLQTMPNVELYPGSPMTASEILDLGIENLIFATGAKWKRVLVGRDMTETDPLDHPNVYTPDDIMSGAVLPDGPVVIFDFDDFYLGGALAEFLALNGGKVSLVTPASAVSTWTQLTNDHHLIKRRLESLDVAIRTGAFVVGFDGQSVELGFDVPSNLEAESLVIVGRRQQNNNLFHEVRADGGFREKGISSVGSIGDCRAPGIIAHAIYSGREYAERFEEPDAEEFNIKQERILI